MKITLHDMWLWIVDAWNWLINFNLMNLLYLISAVFFIGVFFALLSGFAAYPGNLKAAKLVKAKINQAPGKIERLFWAIFMGAILGLFIGLFL